ncbi:ECF transporter S component [Lutispora saccharofermentans]|uniref:Riboflavin transporter n=1 Tax=Lutispora saccharofermentans TaxID=3024236 RepID=A0ABT1NBL5_9FIRM|nr:ECF transporter S component [Lutispora saccharofermentans]MCQ1528655.1 ECF transporter S component [Lutispora saccharofermentans]
MRNSKLQLVTKIGILSALAFLLYLVEFPLPLFPPFLKIDLGDLPAIIGAFALGPWVGVMIELIKNILHLVVRSSTGGIGEVGNFLTGSAYVLVAASMYFRNKSRKTAILGLTTGTIVMAAAMCVFNFFILIPVFTNSPVSMDNIPLILTAILPFNLIKGIVLSIVTLMLYKSLSPILHADVYNEVADKRAR